MVRSTSGRIIALGQHVTKTYPRQQRAVALSTAEAELYAIVVVSAETQAIMAYARDHKMILGGEVRTDSAAALRISQRSLIGQDGRDTVLQRHEGLRKCADRRLLA